MMIGGGRSWVHDGHMHGHARILLIGPVCVCVLITIHRSVRVGIETDKIVKVRQGWRQGVQLVRHPEVGETDVEKWCTYDPTQNTKHPKSGLVPKRFGRVEHEEGHDDDQGQRVHVGRDGQVVAVEEAQHAQRPNHAQYCGQLHEVLFAQMVARIQLEDQHVIDARRPVVPTTPTPVARARARSKKFV